MLSGPSAADPGSAHNGRNKKYKSKCEKKRPQMLVSESMICESPARKPTFWRIFTNASWSTLTCECLQDRRDAGRFTNQNITESTIEDVTCNQAQIPCHRPDHHKKEIRFTNYAI